MGERPPFEREQGSLRRYYGLPTVPAGKGYRSAVGRLVALGIAVAVLFSGGLVLISFLAERF